MSFVSFIQENAVTAGWPKVRVASESLVVIPFNTDEGTIEVYVHPCGKLLGKTVLEFSSPDIPVPTADDMKLSMFELFMRRNGKLVQGHWGMEGSDDDPQCSVMVTQIAETMDPAEFQGAVTAVLLEYQNFLRAFRKATQEGKVDF